MINAQQEVRETGTMADVCSETGLSAWLYLIRVHDKIQRHSTTHLECYELTPAQYDVLAQLNDAPGIPQQELAQRLMVTKGNVCGLINRMSAHGLVERRCDPQDRRINLLYLTELGQKVAVEAVPAYGKFIREHLETLSADEQRTLEGLLRKLDAYLEGH